MYISLRLLHLQLDVIIIHNSTACGVEAIRSVNSRFGVALYNFGGTQNG